MYGIQTPVQGGAVRLARRGEGIVVRKISRGSVKVVLLLVAVLGAAAPAGAQAAPPALTIVAENVTAEGERSEAGVVLPGDEVRYVLTFTNGEATPVRNVVLANPIPAGLEYVAGSASADADGVRIEFSIDGGATFDARPMVERTVEGRVERVAAPAAMYTSVRWTLEDWVESGAQVRAEFRARLSGSEAVR